MRISSRLKNLPWIILVQDVVGKPFLLDLLLVQYRNLRKIFASKCRTRTIRCLTFDNVACVTNMETEIISIITNHQKANPMEKPKTWKLKEDFFHWKG